MFEVAVSPVVRLADAVPPAGRSEWLLARATARPPAPADRDDFAREHVRVALLDCGGSPRADVDLARALCGRLAEARAALRRGEISRTHAKILFEETRELDDPATAAVTTRVLGRGPRRTPAEFRAAVRRAVIRADPVRAELAAARASAQRMVAKRALPDAQAALFVTGPATAVQTIWTALDAHAARPDTPGGGADPAGADGRTLDQRRFDALVTLCRAALGERPPGRCPPPCTCSPTWRPGSGSPTTRSTSTATAPSPPAAPAPTSPTLAGGSSSPTPSPAPRSPSPTAATGPPPAPPGCCTPATAAAPSPAAPPRSPSATPTTTSRTPTAGPPTRTTAGCSAEDTTG